MIKSTLTPKHPLAPIDLGAGPPSREGLPSVRDRLPASRLPQKFGLGSQNIRCRCRRRCRIRRRYPVSLPPSVSLPPPFLPLSLPLSLSLAPSLSLQPRTRSPLTTPARPSGARTSCAGAASCGGHRAPGRLETWGRAGRARRPGSDSDAPAGPCEHARRTRLTWNTSWVTARVPWRR